MASRGSGELLPISRSKPSSRRAEQRGFVGLARDVQGGIWLLFWQPELHFQVAGVQISGVPSGLPDTVLAQGHVNMSVFSATWIGSHWNLVVVATVVVISVIASWLQRDRPRAIGDGESRVFGVFYFNPADPRIFVPKRLGIGWTFNFANRWAQLLMAAVVVCALISVCLR